ncbi:MAG: phospholipid carrier-dependent glycosyltransferase, partial [Oscillospiraceae bacterium]|nr:phospholipid carrier-dependent glycosyltransferase [Oscillospiraceae bacterium]
MEQIWFIPMVATLIAAAIFTFAAINTGVGKPQTRNYFPIERKQLIPLAVIVILYIPLAFWQLGSTNSPGSYAKFTDGSLSLQVSDEQPLPEYVDVAYFSGIGTGEYTVEVYDGAEWYHYAVWSQNYAEILKWHRAAPMGNASPIQEIRITASNPGMQLGELVLTDEYGNYIQLLSSGASAALTDEPYCPVDTNDWMYNSYFDEIYHPRTALEHIEKITPFEISHPPLGKILLSIGIRIFGMNPFGWRFIGALFGILMLIPIYIFVQNMFGRTLVSVCATVLFALDFMHYVQTRIATIDTEAVFFIILMFYFMYRWFVMEPETPLRKVLPMLVLSGVTFGLGAATKWICIYGGLGLAWLWAAKLIRIYKAPKASFAPPPAEQSESNRPIAVKKPKYAANS